MPTQQIQYLPPRGEYETFQSDEHYKGKLKEWGLSTVKTEFWYKERSFQCLVTIKGYETYGNADEYHTLIIEFPDGELSSIHPAFLKEMQQSSFGKESMLTAVEGDGDASASMDLNQTKTAMPEPLEESKPKSEKAAVREKPKAAQAKKEKAPKLVLPTEKVHFTAQVKQFALTYNPFNEENDEVVVLENVQITGEHHLELGLAWCSHSKTMKKFELEPGDQLEFDGKVAAKKLAKGKDAPDEFIVADPVLYKINNPSKINKK